MDDALIILKPLYTAAIFDQVKSVIYKIYSTYSPTPTPTPPTIPPGVPSEIAAGGREAGRPRR